ncbi:hypothetical protein [Streptomyces sp. URMC 125]|uniref:hypothetical protein n=1 Tax=Streptomyces sp. URMC 125 TaxID=3423419 RepID=UPI003F1BD8AC
MSEAVELDWEYLADLADKVAYGIAQSWSVVEKEDVKQEILTHAYAHRKKIEEVYGKEDYLWQIFKKAGTQYASRERDYRDLEDDQYFYTVEEAKLALRTLLYTSEEFSGMIGRDDDLLKCRVTDNLYTARLDMEAALNKLPERYRTLLMRRHVLGLPYESDADRKATSRALLALARQMNRDTRSAPRPYEIPVGV